MAKITGKDARGILKDLPVFGKSIGDIDIAIEMADKALAFTCGDDDCEHCTWATCPLEEIKE